MPISSIVTALKFPLHTAPALVIAVFCVLLWLAQSARMLGIPLLLIVVSFFFKYSFVLLDYVIDGRSEPPAMSAEMMNPVEQRPLGMFLLMIVFFLGMRSLQPVAGTTVVFILSILFLA